MKKWNFIAVLCFTLATSTFLTSAEPVKDNRVGCVNFKRCVEESKLGKREQGTFDGLKKQAESSLEEREKKLNEIADKLNDPDMLDMMSPEAETDLKRQFRSLNQEVSQLQSQFYAALNQANFKIIQQITEVIAKAAEEVAKENNLLFVVNDETFYYFDNRFDVTSKVVAKMDQLFEKEAKLTPTGLPARLP